MMKCNECGTTMEVTAEYPSGEKYYKCDSCGRTVVKTPAAEYVRKEELEPAPVIRPEGFIISKEDFNRLFLDRLAKCKDLVLQKEAEYSQGDVDRMIQFVEDAKMNGITPAQSAWNMMSKHVTSFRLAIQNEETLTEKWIDDRITDMIIYPIIIEAILRRTQMSG